MTKTLEHITTKKPADEEPRVFLRRLHAASMLAFMEASYSIVHQTTMPLPMYRFVYDDTAQHVAFETLEGKALVPADNALDLNMLDMLLASMLKEKMPILLEGKTGVGKTYTVEQFMKTVFPEENYRGLRLNQNMSNVLQPYTEGRIENGLVKIALKTEETDKIAGLFIDEVNRGDTNQVLQLQDSTIRLSSGEGGELGIPIPQYNIDTGVWQINKGEKRPVVVTSAQNPSATKDARYSATKRTDAAQGNRNVQLDVPNGASDIGASVLLLDTSNGHHKAFIKLYKEVLARNMGIDQSVLETLNQDWISLYAFATDPKKNSCPSIHSAMELLDAMLVMTSPDLAKSYKHEKEVLNQWHTRLSSYGVRFTFTHDLDTTAISISKVRDIVQSFEEEIVTRDITKVKKLSDAISLARRVHKAFAADNPVATYLATPNYITVQDVACGFAILLHDKQERHDQDPTTLIDTVLKEYVKIAKDFAEKLGYKKSFEANDPNMSVYAIAFKHALDNSNAGLISKKYSTAAFVKDIGASVAELQRLVSGNEYQKPMLCRMAADLATLAGFANQYKPILEQRIGAVNSQREKVNIFCEVYAEQHGKIGTPDIYLHRLPRVLGR